MKSATSILRYLAGTGLELIGRTFALTATVQSQLTNAQQKSEKDQPNGYAGLGTSSEIYANLIPRYGTSAEINALTGIAGEVASTTDTFDLRLFDGATPGGRSTTLNSKSTIIVQANGSAIANGIALNNAYTLAKSFTPQNSPLAANNRVTIFCMPGVYSLEGLTSALALDTSFIDIIGIGGSNACEIVTSTVGGTHNISQGATNKDYRFQGFRIRRVAPADTTPTLMTMSVSGTSLTFQHVDLNFDNGTAPVTTSVMSMNGGTTSLFWDGLISKCRTTGANMYGGGTNIMLRARIEDCEAGQHSFGGNATGNVSISPGRLDGALIRTRLNGGIVWGASVNCLMWDCDWGSDIQRVGNAGDGTAVKISYSRIKARATFPPITNNVAISIPFCFNQLTSVAVGVNVTNLITTPYNVVSDGI